MRKKFEFKNRRINYEIMNNLIMEEFQTKQKHFQRW